MYKFKLTSDTDFRHKQEREIYQDESKRRVERLEAFHFEEINRIKSEFAAERSNLLTIIETIKNTEPPQRIVYVPQDNAHDKEQLVCLSEKLRVANHTVVELESHVTSLKSEVRQSEFFVGESSEKNKRIEQQ